MVVAQLLITFDCASEISDPVLLSFLLRLDVEPEQKNVAVLDDVLFSF